MLGYNKDQQVKKTKKRRKSASSERKTLSNKLDTLSSKICRLSGRCAICGKSDGVLNAHHFFSRKYKCLRWYLPNLVCLCVYHHTFNFTFSAHKTPEAFKARMIEINGQQWFDDLEARKQAKCSQSVEYLRELYETLKKLLPTSEVSERGL